MDGIGHRLSGVLITPIAFDVTHQLGGVGLLASIAAYLGSTAPDRLEIWQNGELIIPHRTITHWLPLWLLLLWYSYTTLSQTPTYSYLLLSSLGLGFSIGGLLHLSCDLPNPMGVPILTPFHRWSLNLWRSGSMNGIIYLVLFFALFGYFNPVFAIQTPDTLFVHFGDYLWQDINRLTI